jgi:hypothetical protein
MEPAKPAEVERYKQVQKIALRHVREAMQEATASVRVEGVPPADRGQIALGLAVEALTFIRNLDGRDVALSLWTSVRQKVLETQ